MGGKNIIKHMMIMAADVPSPKISFNKRVDMAMSPKNNISPAIAMAQPVMKLCPAARAAALPVIGSTPNAIEISKIGPGSGPNRAMVFWVENFMCSINFPKKINMSA